MMHQWESLQKLAQEWENQEVEDRFVYKPFDYDLQEWDNVPPVIPRFVFYMQNVISKDIEFSKEVYERQTTASLRDEINGYLADHLAKLKAEESARIDDIKKATKRKDKIQEQIENLKKYNKDVKEHHLKKETDNFLSDGFLRLHENFKQQDSLFKEPTFEDNLGLIDWNDKKFHEPRQMSVKQVRDIFFSLLNQSKAQKRIVDCENELPKLFKKCKELNEYCDRLDAKINKNRVELDKQHNDFFETFEQTRDQIQDTLDKHRIKLNTHLNKLEDHHTQILTIHSNIQAILKKQEATDSKIQKKFLNAQDELARVKEENTVRIDELEKNQQDYADHNSQRHNDTRIYMRAEIKHVQDEITANTKNEIDILRAHVQTATENANNNSDNIYGQYDDKLKKIKDVCAQYFSKYEQHLIHHQSLVSDLEKQQKAWVKMIIKPQELNQARLFSVETRLEENENLKVKNIEFLKETIKKLIYAIEQMQLAQGNTMHKTSQLETFRKEVNREKTSIAVGQQLPSLMKGGKSHRKPINFSTLDPMKTSIDQGTSSPPGFFGQNSEEVNYNHMMDSVMSVNSPTNQSTAFNAGGTSEMLFLKRLLYLKASIDSDPTLNAYSVPLEQEKKLINATAEEMGLDPNGVMSGRVSTAHDTHDPSRGLYSVQDKLNIVPNSSHGLRSRGQNNRTVISPVASINNSVNFTQSSEFDQGIDMKKIQTSIPGKRIQRRQIIGKTSNMGLVQNIEQNKFVTSADRYKEQQKAADLAQNFYTPQNDEYSAAFDNMVQQEQNL